MGKARNIVANLAGAKEEIVKCAMYSYCGRLIYDKWNAKERKFDRVSRVVVPIDCGETSRGNLVLYAEDVDDNMHVKQFIVKQIRDFESQGEKRKTAFPIQIDNIRRLLGVRKNLVEQDMAAGVREERNLVAKELCRMAQDIYEFSGCEGNLYSKNKRKDPNSYEKISKEERVARRIVAILTESQKRLVKHFENERKDISFGDYFKWNSDGRCFIPLSNGGTVQDISRIDEPSAKEIFSILDGEGYVCPDYTTGYCYRKSDRDYAAKNPPKVLTILRKALKGDTERFERLSKSFNERKSGSMKRKGEMKLSMCITHNPEDVAGMSTDRDWTSCMRLPCDIHEASEREVRHACRFDDLFEMVCEYYGLFGRDKLSVKEIADRHYVRENEVEMNVKEVTDRIALGGEYHSTALKEVKYGGMCAYLVEEGDTGLDKPFARIAIKRFSGGKDKFIFVAESRVYGDVIVAKSCGFKKALEAELEKSNKITAKGGTEFWRDDETGWSDSGEFRKSVGVTEESLCAMGWNDIYNALKDRSLPSGLKVDERLFEKMLECHRDNPPMGLVYLVEMDNLGNGGLSREFYERHPDVMDMNRWRFLNGESIPSKAVDSKWTSLARKDVIVEQIRKAMEDYSEYEDDIRCLDNGECMYYGKINPYFGKGMNDLPYLVRACCYDSFLDALKLEYESNLGEYSEEYPTFSLFEEAYQNCSLDNIDEVDDALMEKLADESVWYRVSISVDSQHSAGDGSDGEPIFLLYGFVKYELSFIYESRKNSRIAYESNALIDVRSPDWEKKIRRFVGDVYNQLPDESSY